MWYHQYFWFHGCELCRSITQLQSHIRIPINHDAHENEYINIIIIIMNFFPNEIPHVFILLILHNDIISLSSPTQMFVASSIHPSITLDTEHHDPLSLSLSLLSSLSLLTKEEIFVNLYSIPHLFTHLLKQYYHPSHYVTTHQHTTCRLHYLHFFFLLDYWYVMSIHPMKVTHEDLILQAR